MSHRKVILYVRYIFTIDDTINAMFADDMALQIKKIQIATDNLHIGINNNCFDKTTKDQTKKN